MVLVKTKFDICDVPSFYLPRPPDNLLCPLLTKDYIIFGPLHTRVFHFED